MPSFEALEPLAPDACRSDPSAPCHYWHLKVHALNGGRDKLSERDFTFVGIGGPLHTPGWRSVSGLSLLASVDEQDSDPWLTATLQALVSRDRLEFLG